MRMRRRAAIAALAGFGLIAGVNLSGPALAQGKSTKIVVAFPPGGPIDFVARVLQEPLTKELGHPIIVENKAGGNTIIAAEMVARSPADGSVVFLTSMTTVVMNPLLYATLPYDVEKDFSPVSLIVTVPTILAVNSASPLKDANELVAASKAGGKPMPFASAGAGGTTHIALEMFTDSTGAKTLHVPFKGAAPAIADLINNQVGAFFGDLPGLMPHFTGGKLKAIAVAARQGTPLLPGIKTMAELGIKDVVMENWYGLLLPAKAPADIVAKFNKALHAALADPAIAKKLINSGAAITPSTPEELAKTILADRARFAPIIKAKNIKVE